MRNILVIAFILAIIGVTIGVVSNASEEDTVTATVEIGDISVTITPTSFDYYSMPYSATSTSYSLLGVGGEQPGSGHNIAALVGAVETDLDIKASGTADWTLDATIGADTYVHKFGLADGETTEPGSYAALTDTYVPLTTAVTSSTSIYFGLEIQVPASGTTTQQSAPVYVLASWTE